LEKKVKNFKTFFSFLRKASNLQILRLNKAWREAYEQGEQTHAIYSLLYDALLSSDSKPVFRAIQFMLPKDLEKGAES